MQIVMKIGALIAITAGVLFSAPALSSDTVTVTLGKTQNPIPHKFLDVLGFYPGQPGAETQALVAKVQKQNPDTMNITLTPTVRGVYVKTSYRGAMRVQVDENDRVELYTGSPVTDSQIIGIYRFVSFKDPFSAPTSDDMAKSLIAKYGTPSFDNRSKGVRELTWLVTGPGTVKPCKDSVACIRNIDLHNPSRNDAETALKQGLISVMKANLSITTEMRVSSMSLRIDDYENRVLDARSTEKFIDDTISKQLSNGKSTQPKL